MRNRNLKKSSLVRGKKNKFIKEDIEHNKWKKTTRIYGGPVPVASKDDIRFMSYVERGTSILYSVEYYVLHLKKFMNKKLSLQFGGPKKKFVSIV